MFNQSHYASTQSTKTPQSKFGKGKENIEKKKSKSPTITKKFTLFSTN